MKRVILTIILAAVAAFAASAQAPTIERNGRFLSINGVKLSDQDVRDIISPSVYSETYEGARTQVEAGRKLRIAGFSAFGAGLVAMIGSEVAIVAMQDSYDDYMPVFPIITYVTGIVAMTAGLTCVEASIPLTIIGKRRLEWVSADYNAGNHASKVNLQFGAQDHGFGLALKF
ncbi:MAG: hypothetical protein MJZ16_05485 [Bacteroidales bacterium]|nr:hypothetical protein [Bacteroidales bacterium]